MPRLAPDAAAEPLRARLEETFPRATALTRRTMAAFPVRVWRRFLRRNGFLLSAGVSYQGLFALFGLLYLSFAAAGLWLGGSPQAVEALIRLANSYIPGIIGQHGLATAEEVQSIASGSTNVLSITGAVALAVVLWTTINAVTFTRRAVRGIFGLPYDDRSFVLLKVRDAVAGLAFGFSLILGSVLSVIGVWALRQVFDFFGLSLSLPIYDVAVRAAAVLAMFAVDAGALALLVRFLTGTDLAWRTIVPGALLGAGGLVVLQLGAGLLLSHSPGNPLLATFAVIVALLLWCRWVAMVILVAASWIAVTAEDRDEPLEQTDEAAARRAELRALMLAARVRLHRAEQEYDDAAWWRRPAASRTRQRAHEEWREAVAEAAAAGVVTDDEDVAAAR